MPACFVSREKRASEKNYSPHSILFWEICHQQVSDFPVFFFLLMHSCSLVIQTTCRVPNVSIWTDFKLDVIYGIEMNSTLLTNVSQWKVIMEHAVM